MATAKKAASRSAGAKAAGRFHTRDDVKQIVWIRTAGHCELCGTDLTYDFRVGTPMKWGEVAHILPASPRGPRADADHGPEKAESLTNNFSNLMLACPGCHNKIDRDEEGYPLEDLSGLHKAFLDRISLAAKAPEAGKAMGLIVLSKHHSTLNTIRNHDLLAAMSAEGLAWIDHPLNHVLPEPGANGRDAAYWQHVTDSIRHQLAVNLRRASSFHGDIPGLAVAGLADIGALMMLGQVIGDRSTRYLFSPNRGNGLRWPDPTAVPPDFLYTPPPAGTGPIALVLSLSAKVPLRDVLAVLPDARIAEFTIAEPSVSMVKNRGVINAFRDALQTRLSELEADSAEPIHVFPAIPAATAIEFGALLTMQHQHPYQIYDRDGRPANAFEPVLTLGRKPEESIQ
jgi:hypothetical protein